MTATETKPITRERLVQAREAAAIDRSLLARELAVGGPWLKRVEDYQPFDPEFGKRYLETVRNIHADRSEALARVLRDE